MSRIDGRGLDEIRPVNIVLDYLDYAEGSVLIEQGGTRVLCAVSLEERIPQWMRGEGRGWVTAEYSMLPRATLTRTPRERGTSSGRSHEISRLVGRSLRAVVDFSELGERTLTVDCDVIQADAGTRTAAITGSYVALHMACEKMKREGIITNNPLRTFVGAISVGLLQGEVLLDLCYEEDLAAEVDFNVVMTGDDRLVEVQGTAETASFTRDQMDEILDLASNGIQRLFQKQKVALGVE